MLFNKLIFLNQTPVPPTPPVSWATGTDAEIKTMIDAADAGLIDLSDYWSIGDTRTVHLSAMSSGTDIPSHAEQDVQFVIMDFDCTGFTTSNETPNAIVGMKDCLLEYQRMYNGQNNGRAWSGSAMRTFCNNQFKDAIPSTFLPIFKQFTWSTSKAGYNTGVYELQDYFALPVIKCVTGEVSGSRTDEADLYSQWEYYEEVSNRSKGVGIGGQSENWWTASPETAYYGFLNVRSGGSIISSSRPSSYCYVSPFGCI